MATLDKPDDEHGSGNGNGYDYSSVSSYSLGLETQLSLITLHRLYVNAKLSDKIDLLASVALNASRFELLLASSESLVEACTKLDVSGYAISKASTKLSLQGKTSRELDLLMLSTMIRQAIAEHKLKSRAKAEATGEWNLDLGA